MNQFDWEKLSLPERFRGLLEAARFEWVGSVEELSGSACGQAQSNFGEVEYEIPNQAAVVDAQVAKVRNGVVVNYPEPYMRRREPGDAHVIRNAGGIVSDDVLRSLAVSHWLTGTERALIIGHTGCGMLAFDNRSLSERIARETGRELGELDFLPFSDLEASVRRSVRRVRESPLLPDGYCASGYVYEIRSGELRELAEIERPATP